MFENIGQKIKGLAKVVFYLEAIVAVIYGLGLIFEGIDYEEGLVIFGGLAAMVIGPLVAWLSTVLLYGFGELIDKASEIANNTRK